MALSCLLLAGCQSETPYGRCVGINQQPDSALVYEYSARNIVVGIATVEFIVPPVLVGLNELKCPVARRFPVPSDRGER